jgi:hypothetical protein
MEACAEAPVLFDNSDPAHVFIFYLYIQPLFIYNLTPTTLKPHTFLTVTPF